MENKKSNKKKAAGIMTVILIIILLLVGTLAWQDYSQHASNEFVGDGVSPLYIAHLVEDFEEVTNWKSTDEPIKKEVRVTNLGSTEEYPGNPWDYGDVYVRLQLKEYMEYNENSYEYEYSDNRFMIDETGNFIKFETKEKALEDGYKEADLEEIQGYEDEKEYWYIVTKAHDPNGQYGKFLIIGVDNDADGDKTPLVPDTERASADAADPAKHHSDQPNGECEYPIHEWDENNIAKCDHGFHEYIEWILGDDVIGVEDWDGELDEVWVVDHETGWAYWAVPLRSGRTTSNILEKVNLITDPPGAFYYTIHVDMEAVSLEELWDESEMPDGLRDKYTEAAENPGGLTGTTADVGYRFIADGYEWIGLDIDNNRNIRIMTSNVIETSPIGSSAVYSNAGSEVRKTMDKIHGKLDELKPYTRKTIITNAELNSTTSVTKAAPKNYAAADGFNMTPLTYAEVEKYFKTAAERIAKDINGTVATYWLVNYTSNSVYLVTVTGAINPTNAATEHGIRPAMYVNVTDTE